MKARVVTVHLVIAETNDNEPGTEYQTAADIADGVSALLGEAEASGFLLDWGYAKGGMPEQASEIDSDRFPEGYQYEEGDFYDLCHLPSPNEHVAVSSK